MPQVPRLTTPDQLGSVELQPQRINAPEQAFGTARGEAALAQGLGEAANETERTALYAQGLHDEATAQEANIAASRDAMAFMSDPKTGFMAKQGRDALAAYPTVAPTLEAIRSQYRENLSPMAAKMFDQAFVRRMEYMQESMSNYARIQGKQYREDQQAGSIALHVQQAGLAANDPQTFDNELKTAEAYQVQLSQDKGESEEATQFAIQKIRGDAWTARIDQLAVHNPGEARRVFEDNRDAIPAAHAAIIDQKIMARQQFMLSQQEHAERMAEHRARLGRAQLTGQIIAGIAEGKRPDPSDVAHLLSVNAITTTGYNAIQKALTGNGKDDPDTVLDLQHRAVAHAAMTEQAQSQDTLLDDIQQAQADGKISTKSALSLQKTALTTGTKMDAEHRSRWFQQTKSDLGSQLLESPIPYFAKEEAARWQQNLSIAMNEFNNRVEDGEDPKTVHDDVVTRYYLGDNIPSTYPQPTVGVVREPADLARVFQANEAAKANGALRPDAYQENLRRLNAMSEFLKARPAKPSGPKGPKPAAGASKGVE